MVDGLIDEKAETWEGSEKKVRHMLKNKLGLDSDSIQIERAHRVGPYKENGRARQIVVRLQRFKDKQLILSSAKKLKGTNL